MISFKRLNSKINYSANSVNIQTKSMLNLMKLKHQMPAIL